MTNNKKLIKRIYALILIITLAAGTAFSGTAANAVFAGGSSASGALELYDYSTKSTYTYNNAQLKYTYNGIKTMDENRLPIDGSFYDSGRAGYNGITYGLVIKEVEANPINMFMFLFGDSETEAYNNYNKLEGVTPVQVPTTQASTATVSE